MNATFKITFTYFNALIKKGTEFPLCLSHKKKEMPFDSVLWARSKCTLYAMIVPLCGKFFVFNAENSYIETL